MPKVIFTQNIQRHVNLPPSEVQGSTVKEALDAVFENKPRARGYVLDEHGELRKHMMIFVSNHMLADRKSLSDPVNQDTEIYIMQALSGG